MFAGTWMEGYNYLTPKSIMLNFNLDAEPTWNCDMQFKFEIVYHNNTSNDKILTYNGEKRDCGGRYKKDIKKELMKVNHPAEFKKLLPGAEYQFRFISGEGVASTQVTMAPIKLLKDDVKFVGNESKPTSVHLTFNPRKSLFDELKVKVKAPESSECSEIIAKKNVNNDDKSRIFEEGNNGTWKAILIFKGCQEKKVINGRRSTLQMRLKSGTEIGKWTEVKVTTAPLKVTNLTIGQLEKSNNANLVSVNWNVEQSSYQTSFEINVNGNKTNIPIPLQEGKTSFSKKIKTRTGVRNNVSIVALSGNVMSDATFNNTYLVPLAKVAGLVLTKMESGKVKVFWDEPNTEENQYDAFQIR